MAKRKISLAFILAIMIFAVAVFVACGTDDADESDRTGMTDPSEILQNAENTVDLTDSEEELNTGWSSADVVISFSNSGITVSNLSSSYYSVSGNTLTVEAAEAKTYVFTGTSGNARVVFNKKNEDHIIFNGLNLTSATSAPVSFMKKADRVLTLADGTSNSLADAAVYTEYDNTEGDEPNAALFAKNSLTVNGGGSLTVTGNNNNGIGSKDTLKVLGGNITVTAVNNALKGNDAVLLKGGTLSLTSAEDGIKSDATDDTTGEALGYVYFENANVSITSKQDAVQAEKLLYVKSGTVTAKTNGGAAANTSSSSSNNNRPGWGWNEPTSGDGVSRKGLKGGGSVLVEGGTVDLDCYDDAVHSDGAVYVGGGNITVKSGDDGFHADSFLTIDGGTVAVKSSYEGLEAAKVTINGGDIDVTAADDGINASDGTNNAVGNNNANCYIAINGGSITVTAGGDGLDSNGKLTISGGNVTVHGSSSTPEEGLDADGGIYINGGTVAASGPSSLMDTPNTGSEQNVLMIFFTSAQSSGRVITVRDSGGTTVLSYTGVKSFQSLILSGEKLKTGETYTVYQDSTSYKSVKISSRVTTVGTNSNQGGGKW